MEFDGPHRIARTGQIALTKRVRDAVGIDVNQDVYLVVDDVHPDVIQVVPERLAMSWLHTGRDTVANPPNSARRSPR
jgi:hypothetical protein